MKFNEKTPALLEQSEGQKSLVGAGSRDTVTQVRRRKEAASRCEPLTCGHHDPHECSATCEPSTYGLTRSELKAEVRRLATYGWQLWELRQRLQVAPRAVTR